MNDDAYSPTQWGLGILLGSLGFILLCSALFGSCAAGRSYSRYQNRMDLSQKRSQALKNERNKVKVNDIRIAQTQQLVKVEQQKAAIRLADAIGIRKAQDEISKTLTPLYVQFEAIKAQEKMANGRNHTVVYVPSGNNGVPLVQTVAK